MFSLRRAWRAKTRVINSQQIRSLTLHEYQSHRLLAKFGVTVPSGQVACTPDEVGQAVKHSGQRCVIRSQVLGHERGKAVFQNGLQGGIQTVDSPDHATALASKMLGHRLANPRSSGPGTLVQKLYVVEQVQYDEEWYLSLTLDRENYTPVVALARGRGADVDPANQHTFPYRLDVGITPELVSQIGEVLETSPKELEGLENILARLHKLFVSKDITSLEINQLVKTSNGTFTCLDARVTFDDASEKRQPEIFALRDREAEVAEEVEAQEHGLVYIKLQGDIGNVVNGAGLAMATNDAIAHHGGSSANFLDAGGQATKKTMVKAFEIILRDERIKVILVNIYGGIIKCDMIAESIIGAAEELGPLRVPLVVRLQGTNSEQGLEILEKANLGFHVISEFGEAARKAVEISKQSN